MFPHASPDLLHLVGYLTGASLFAMLLAMVVRTRRPDRLMIVTAALGLAWNTGELLVQGTRRLESSGLESWLQAASYSALGGLAAVVIHSVTQPSTERTPSPARGLHTLLPAAAYLLAAAAAALHAAAALSGALVPSRGGLVLLTVGLIALAPPLVLITRRQTRDRRALWMTALTLFAVSALHLGSPHQDGESWALELLGHHASIPLAFAILYEDYRFALADLFLKQALTLIAIVTLAFVSWSAVVGEDPAAAADRSGLLLALWVGTALAYPLVRRGVVGFVDRFVLRRDDYAHLLDRCTAALQACDHETAVLDRLCAMLTPALTAVHVGWQALPASAPASTTHVVEVLPADEPRYRLVIGPLAGGRRLLSDDSTLLDRLAIVAARRIDVLRLTEERYARVLREQETQTLATEAELRALRSQINPHFLFNALTTIGHLIREAPPRAFETLLQLTTLLRSVLRSEGAFTTLGQECDLIGCYLDIERARFEERLQADLQIPAELRDVPIPALVIQPLVENAVKHGIAPARQGGGITITAAPDDDTGTRLRIRVRNTGAPLRGGTDGRGNGLGLQNVERRLSCHYGGAARLSLWSDEAGATYAEILLPVVVGPRREMVEA